MTSSAIWEPRSDGAYAPQGIEGPRIASRLELVFSRALTSRREQPRRGPQGTRPKRLSSSLFVANDLLVDFCVICEKEVWRARRLPDPHSFPQLLQGLPRRPAAVGAWAGRRWGAPGRCRPAPQPVDRGRRAGPGSPNSRGGDHGHPLGADARLAEAAHVFDVAAAGEAGASAQNQRPSQATAECRPSGVQTWMACGSRWRSPSCRVRPISGRPMHRT